MINCNNIHKSFGTQLVLNKISAEFSAGGISVILGASGCGKSTLLNIIAQVDTADSGEALIKTAQATPLTDYNKKKYSHGIPLIGMVQQKHNLWPHLNVLQNLTLAPIKVLKHSAFKANKAALKLLNEFALTDKAKVHPQQLSGGEQQRIAIIRSMLLPYQAIALDEPTASLDPVATAQVANTLTHLKKNNKAIIVTTHDIEFAKQIADKVFFINQGQMAEVGEKDILFQPKTKQLKLFLNTGEIT